jgi:hypothetical protein
MSGPSWRASCRRRETDDSQSATAAAISSGYEVTKEEARRRQVPQLARIDSALARPQSWDHEAPDQRAAEAEAVKLFGLNEEQRKRLLILERD